MSTITLNGNLELRTPLFVGNDQELVVLPGTVITCFSTTFPTTAQTLANTGMIICAAGSKILMNGTKENPITIQGTGAGISVCSYDASTPKSVLDNFTEAEVGSPIYNALKYGNWPELVGRETNISINYVQIVNAGFIVDRDGGKEFNSLSLCGVKTSSIHNIKVINAVDDGIEIFSGDVRGSNWVVENANDDALDVDQGANVSVTNILLVQSHNHMIHLEMGSLKNDLGNSLLIASNVLTNGTIRTILKENTQVLLSGTFTNVGRPSLKFDYNSWGIKVNDFGVTNQMINFPS